MCICVLLQCEVSWALCLWNCDPESVLPPGKPCPRWTSLPSCTVEPVQSVGHPSKT